MSRRYAGVNCRCRFDSPTECALLTSSFVMVVLRWFFKVESFRYRCLCFEGATITRPLLFFGDDLKNSSRFQLAFHQRAQSQPGSSEGIGPKSSLPFVDSARTIALAASSSLMPFA